MKRKAMLAAALGLLVVGCQSEFDRCMEVGTPINVWLSSSGSSKGPSETDIMLGKAETWRGCAPQGRKRI